MPQANLPHVKEQLADGAIHQVIGLATGLGLDWQPNMITMPGTEGRHRGPRGSAMRRQSRKEGCVWSSHAGDRAGGLVVGTGKDGDGSWQRACHAPGPLVALAGLSPWAAACRRMVAWSRAALLRIAVRATGAARPSFGQQHAGLPSGAQQVGSQKGEFLGEDEIAKIDAPVLLLPEHDANPEGSLNRSPPQISPPLIRSAVAKARRPRARRALIGRAGRYQSWGW